ncbi:MAG: hypothetical protein A2Y62_16660 [Candidatus Fischerbacteria bacterium RBG_13_37_8]|uniref:DUF5615 domain-containing protein n=1 Tax=Candidatus Fischerbacteria bacterium RBG_13_37_8 TaxID=1817863 RepID=A0A1F5VNS6_9BACT|nr:MAG: hypothetical protein A2Y62_16660 [Candidatus Fischerbacteria bacterium RBG_13_37_8]
MLLADENISPRTVSFLRSLGYKVFDLRENNLTSISDEEILKLAKKKNSVLITMDKHFANIIKYPPKDYAGIIRIRIHPPLLGEINKALQYLLNNISIENLRGSLIILEKIGYRIRR